SLDFEADREHLPAAPYDRDQFVAERFSVLDRLDVVKADGESQFLDSGAGHHEVLAINLDPDVRVIRLDDKDSLGSFEVEDGGNVVHGLFGHGAHASQEAQTSQEEAGRDGPSRYEPTVRRAANQFTWQRDGRGLLHMCQTATEQVSDLGRRPVTVGRVLG